MEQSFNKIQNDNNSLAVSLSALETRNLQISKELIESEQKLQRARIQLNKYTFSLHSLTCVCRLIKGWKTKKNIADSQHTFIEDDLNLQQMKQANTISLYLLAQLAGTRPDLYAQVEQIVTQAGFQLPSRAPSTTGSATTSTGVHSSSSSRAGTTPGTPTKQGLQRSGSSPSSVALSFQAPVAKSNNSPPQKSGSRPASRPSSASKLPRITSPKSQSTSALLVSNSSPSTIKLPPPTNKH